MWRALLSLGDAQVAALGGVARAVFEERVGDHARRCFPEPCERLGGAPLSELIRYGMERAARHGIAGERDVCRYLGAMLVFGADFDVEQPWAAEVLAGRHSGGPAEAMFLLHAEAVRRAGSEAGALVQSGEGAEVFSARRIGACVEGATSGGYVGFELRDPSGRPLTGDYVLEHPDGTLELGRLRGGALYRSDVQQGDYSVHLPEIVEVRWEAGSVAPGGGEVGLVVRHRCFQAGTLALFEIHRASPGAGMSPIAEMEVHLAGDDRRLLEEQETRASLRLDRCPGLPAAGCALMFTVTIEEKAAACGSPLFVLPTEARSTHA